MPLTKDQLDQFVHALCDRFDEASLDQFVALQLEGNLYTDYAGRHLPLKKLALDFVRKVDEKGMAVRVLRLLAKERANEPRFGKLAEELEAQAACPASPVPETDNNPPTISDAPPNSSQTTVPSEPPEAPLQVPTSGRLNSPPPRPLMWWLSRIALAVSVCLIAGLAFDCIQTRKRLSTANSQLGSGKESLREAHEETDATKTKLSSTQGELKNLKSQYETERQRFKSLKVKEVEVNKLAHVLANGPSDASDVRQGDFVLVRGHVRADNRHYPSNPQLELIGEGPEGRRITVYLQTTVDREGDLLGKSVSCIGRVTWDEITQTWRVLEAVFTGR